MGADRGLHVFDPPARDSVGTAIVESGNDIMFEQFVESFGFDLFLIVWILVSLAFSDGPADASGLVLTAPDLVPPAVECAQVQRTVSSRLHPTCPTAGNIGCIEDVVDQLAASPLVYTK